MIPRPRWGIAALAALLVMELGCRSLPAKERAVLSTRAFHEAVAALQDAEIAAFTSGQFPGLTLQKHQEFHRLLVRVFEAELRLIPALKAWQAGSPAPPSLAEAVAIANEVVAYLQTIPETATLAGYARVILDTLDLLGRQIGDS